jgi:hypothetical protein
MSASRFIPAAAWPATAWTRHVAVSGSSARDMKMSSPSVRDTIVRRGAIVV